jgi:hypothetical protein
MDGYTAWKLHRAVSFHLLQKKYDLFEHNGRTKHSSLDCYLKQRDNKMFEIMAKSFTKPNDIVQFFVANIVYTGKDITYDLATCWENYLKWVKNKESLTKRISDDISLLDLPRDIEEGNPPRLMTMILSGKILPETAVAINRVRPFIDKWIDKDYFGCGNYPNIIKKLDSKLMSKYNTEAIKTLIEEHETVH